MESWIFLTSLHFFLPSVLHLHCFLRVLEEYLKFTFSFTNLIFYVIYHSSGTVVLNWLILFLLSMQSVLLSKQFLWGLQLHFHDSAWEIERCSFFLFPLALDLFWCKAPVLTLGNEWPSLLKVWGCLCPPQKPLCVWSSLLTRGGSLRDCRPHSSDPGKEGLKDCVSLVDPTCSDTQGKCPAWGMVGCSACFLSPSLSSHVLAPAGSPWLSGDSCPLYKPTTLRLAEPSVHAVAWSPYCLGCLLLNDTDGIKMCLPGLEGSFLSADPCTAHLHWRCKKCCAAPTHSLGDGSVGFSFHISSGPFHRSWGWWDFAKSSPHSGHGWSRAGWAYLCFNCYNKIVTVRLDC